MEDNLLSLVPLKLASIIISNDFEDIRKSLTPTNVTLGLPCTDAIGLDVIWPQPPTEKQQQNALTF
jgi:hypothetical protein